MDGLRERDSAWRLRPLPPILEKKRGRAVGKQVDPIWATVVCLVPALLTPRELLNGLSIWANFTTQGTSTCQFVLASSFWYPRFLN